MLFLPVKFVIKLIDIPNNDAIHVTNYRTYMFITKSKGIHQKLYPSIRSEKADILLIGDHCSMSFSF